ncbi:hypothetical protein SI65_01974 [Aspergillus cristatus]|uniref:SRR1-like domain-containing protein n=1 Tax=Aspergillus cristatus TaxID=573508 RepID=A0A1E3BTN6_ASPCR|nr:hypothetical protein SI65_01908 [Aspergillus cristatus]ODM24384.1 hypothetical protein SI65_01974 [Aspergillus cristatus]
MATNKEPTSVIVQKVLERYEAGIPLFTREVLEDINRQLEEGRNSVTIKDYYGRECNYTLKKSKSAAVSIGYRSIDALTQLMPSDPGSKHNERPVTIASTSYGTQKHATVEQIRTAFEHEQTAWKESKACQNLTEQIKSLTADGITKIVGFGLGAVAYQVEDVGRETRRALAQHAAMLTIAEGLEQKGKHEVKCYSQDPVNEGAGNEFLKTIGITPLDNPKGFLAVDGEMLVVMSISPNIPVRQVVADISRPVAMLVNTIEEKPKREWKWMTMEDGHFTCLSPYSTDPVSSRVLRMAEDYDEFPFNYADDMFGKVALYVKKDNVT